MINKFLKHMRKEHRIVSIILVVIFFVGGSVWYFKSHAADAPGKGGSPSVSIMSSKITSLTQFTIVYSGPVNTTVGDYTNLLIDGHIATSVDSITVGGACSMSAAGCDTQIITFTPSVATTPISTGVVDIAALLDSGSGNTFPGQTGQVLSDGQAPVVTNVTSPLANGTYTVGQVVPITVTFSKAVTVTGTPQLSLSTTLSTTTAVDYSSGTGTTDLTFNYTVLADDNSADLDYASVDALTAAPAAAAPASKAAPAAAPVVPPVVVPPDPVVIPAPHAAADPFDYLFSTSIAFAADAAASKGDPAPASALIQDATGNDAILMLPSPGTVGSLSYNKDIVIDTALVPVSAASNSSLTFITEAEVKPAAVAKPAAAKSDAAPAVAAVKPATSATAAVAPTAAQKPEVSSSSAGLSVEPSVGILPGPTTIDTSTLEKLVVNQALTISPSVSVPDPTFISAANNQNVQNKIAINLVDKLVATGPVLQPGTMGTQVRTLQQLLVSLKTGPAALALQKIQITGLYSPRLVSAVKEFQKSSKLAPTGIVDTNTKKDLMKMYLLKKL